MRPLGPFLDVGELRLDVRAEFLRQARDALPERHEIGNRRPGINRRRVLLRQYPRDASRRHANGPGQGHRLRLFRQHGHVVERALERYEVLLQERERVVVPQHQVLARDAFERVDLLREEPVVLRGADTGDDELLALFGKSIEIEERPDHRQQQRQRDEPEANQDQAV